MLRRSLLVAWLLCAVESTDKKYIFVTGGEAAWLVEWFGKMLREVHSQALPGAQRDGVLTGSGRLPEYMALVGREKTFQRFSSPSCQPRSLCRR